jgi:beta-phosphoglucomutase
MKLTAAIFDLNGTILSDEDQWAQAFVTVLKKLGAKDLPNHPHVHGIGVEENWPMLVQKYHLKTTKTYDLLASETKKEYRKLIDKVELAEGFETFINDLRDSGVITALATSNTWDGIEDVLDQFDLEPYFDTIVTGEEATHKKPSPEIFNIVSERLALDPLECLVFEDSQAGVEAAISAGMKVIGLYRDDEHKKTLADADALVKNFGQMTPAIIANLE